MVQRILTAAVIALMVASGAASAATITKNGTTVNTNTSSFAIGDDLTFTDALSPNDGISLYSFTFTATQRAVVSFIALAATGVSSGADIQNVRFGYNSPPSQSFSAPVVLPGGSAFATGSLIGFTINKGSSFSVYFSEVQQLMKTVGVTGSFTVAAVPIPASLPIFASALALLGLARRRRSSQI